MRSELTHSYIYVIFDETSDADGRATMLVLAGALKQSEATRSFVLSCEEMKKVNGNTVSQV